MSETTRVGLMSDGYHTFDELYEHRHALFINLMKMCGPSMAWFSDSHEDGKMEGGWFIAGIDLPSGTITYHLPTELMDKVVATGAAQLDYGKPWDGHTPADVVKRLMENI